MTNKKKMSLIDVEKANLQLQKFNENLQKVVLKTKLVIEKIMAKDVNIKSSYKNVPSTLDIAMCVIQGSFPVPGFDRIYGTICGFLDKYNLGLSNGIDLFDMINNKDDKILTEHLSALFPENKYIDKIQYIYGANPEGKRYVEKDDVDFMWRLINGVMHRAIKWAIFSQDPRYVDTVPSSTLDRFKINPEN